MITLPYGQHPQVSQVKNLSTSSTCFEADDVVLNELSYIRALGSKRSLAIAASNLGAYEAILMIMLAGDDGLPVYEAIQGVESRFCSQSGLLKRLRILRTEGLIEHRIGRKRSEVRLVVSTRFYEELLSVLQRKYGNSTLIPAIMHGNQPTVER